MKQTNLGERATFLAAGLAACWFAAPSAQAADIELSPGMPWNVDWANDSCVAQRVFGDKDQPFVLRMERFAPSASFQLVISGKQLHGAEQGDALTVTYGEGGHAHRIEDIRVGARKDGATTIFVNNSSLAPLPRWGNTDQPSSAITPQAEAAVTQIALRHKARTIVLKTGSLGPLFAQMRKCTDQLVTAWGLDPVQQQTLRRKPTPIGSPGQWATSLDYPQAALLERKQAIVAFRLMVDAEGKPTSCALQRSYSGELFNTLTCNILMRRARFQPALDAMGKPVASYFISQVNWLMGN